MKKKFRNYQALCLFHVVPLIMITSIFYFMLIRNLLLFNIQSGCTIHATMHSYEIDSLCYFIKISYDYWKATGITENFDIAWFKSLLFILNVWESSSYRYLELSPSSGSPICYTVMSWCGFRPSDDRCTFHYHIPSSLKIRCKFLYFIIKEP